MSNAVGVTPFVDSDDEVPTPETPDLKFTTPPHPADRSTPSIPLIAATDAAWNKRGTGRAYNSLSGFSSLVGYRSGKVLSYTVRSKRCALCEKGHKPEDHDCRRNWTKSAKAMEPAMAVEMITKNSQLQDSGCHISTVIGDDDSSMIQAVRRESVHQVEKWSDIAHAKKALSNAMYALKLPDSVMEYIRVCFVSVLEKNKGNSEATRGAIFNIVQHAFGNHDQCHKFGDWCRYFNDPQNYKHTGLPGGKPLSGLELKSALSKILDRFAKNAEKLSPCGSSQANENFNNMVASKHPKSRHYASSESLNFRVTDAVAQKNIGTKYIVDVNSNIELSPGELTKKFRMKKDLQRAARSIVQKSKEYKRKRLFDKRQRNRKSAALERKEGINYSTECGLEGIAQLVDDPIIPQKAPSREESVYVIFDMETTGLSKLTAEVCQIAAKCGQREFSVYIIPQKGIPNHVSVLTGLTVENGEMFSNGERVRKTPPRLALSNFIEFLRSIGTNINLTAHNGWNYDFPIIMRDIRKINLLEDFSYYVKGFTDTLPVFKSKLPDRVKEKKKFSQGALPDDFKISILNAHNALGDVRMLDLLITATSVSRSDLYEHTRSVAWLVGNEERLALVPANKSLMECLKPGVSVSMISKMAASGISLKVLQSTFKNGENAFQFLLGEDIGGKPRVTRHKKTVKNTSDATAKTFV